MHHALDWLPRRFLQGSPEIIGDSVAVGVGCKVVVQALRQGSGGQGGGGGEGREGGKGRVKGEEDGEEGLEEQGEWSKCLMR